MRVPEEVTEDQRKVRIFIIKNIPRVEITRFTQFNKQHDKQGKMILGILEE